MGWRQHMGSVHPKLLDAVMEHTVERHYDTDEVLCREGDPADGMYLLDVGRVLVQSSSVDGAPVGLIVVDAGSVVGERALVADNQLGATVQAVRPTAVRLLRPSGLRELREQRPEIDQFLVQVFDTRLREMSARLAEAAQSSADERVCRRVKTLGTAYDGTVRLSQAKLAGLAGTTRPTVNRVLQSLQDEGVIVIRRARLEVVDSQALDARVPSLNGISR